MFTKSIEMPGLFFLCCLLLDSRVFSLNSEPGKTAVGKELNSVVSSANNGEKGVDQLRASSQFYYPTVGQQFQQQQQNVPLNRDSYVEAASDFGYNNLDGQNQHNHAHAHAHAPSHGHSHQSSYSVPSSSYGLTGGYDDDFEFGGGLGALGGLAGLLGLKGLKGLGILGLLKAGFLGIAPLFLLLLPALIIVPILLFFLPIPVITVPTAGRAFSPLPGFNLNLTEWTGKMTNLARSVMESDKCIERISCEMSRLSRGSIIDRTIKRVITRFETQMPGTLKRMARAYLEPVGCKRYGCFVMDDFQTKKPVLF